MVSGILYAENKEISLNMSVQNEAGMPVKGAEVSIFNYNQRDKIQPKGKTDGKGFFRAEFESVLLVEVMVRKKGHYDTRALEVPKKYWAKTSVLDKQPFVVVLKRVKHRTAMYAKNLMNEGAGPLVFPKGAENAGFDLVEGDWVKPYGKGKMADFIFTVGHVLGKDGVAKRVLKLGFQNKKDGVLPFKAPLHKGSVLVSDHTAPEFGYQSEWQQIINAKGEISVLNRRANQNYYFRVRTKIDSKGQIASAHYGKIYGDFLSFIYYFNPTANDRNVEFDVGKNLFRNQTWKEKVSFP